MPQPERRPGGPNPEREGLPRYHLAARFRSEEAAGQAYGTAQEFIYRGPEELELSVYRLMLNLVYHVAAVGDPPPEQIDRELRDILSAGEPAELPGDVVAALNQRRLQARRLGPWVEGHHRLGKRLP